jgi:hypothetical protein
LEESNGVLEALNGALEASNGRRWNGRSRRLIAPGITMVFSTL